MTFDAGRRTQASRMAQIGLALILLVVDFAHGIALGEHNVGFHPIYRVRQSLAIAISRLHEPPATGYLAYGSVVDAFVARRDSASSTRDPRAAPRSRRLGRAADDPARMEQALQDAENVAIDPSRPPKLLMGNEIAYVDYIYDAFRLFGVHMTSLYYFYFLLLAGSVISVSDPIPQLRPVPVRTRALFRGGLSDRDLRPLGGRAVADPANSRFSSAWPCFRPCMSSSLCGDERRSTPTTFLIVLAQSMLLAFVVVCRVTADMADRHDRGLRDSDGGLGQSGLPRGAPIGADGSASGLAPWPSSRSAPAWRSSTSRPTPPTRREPKYHVVWHEILLGLLRSSQALNEAYLHGGIVQGPTRTLSKPS